jgi:divalent metal cation (Fe/Co/Zn/Cd) transporter
VHAAAAVPEAPNPPNSPAGRRLEWLTIGWNAMEVGVTVALGVAAGSLALVAFGVDSLVEIFASLVVVWHMNDRGAKQGGRRTPALRLVSVAFGLLAVSLLAGAVDGIISDRRPDSSPWGMAYLGITALVMFALASLKRRAAVGVDDDPLRAEASMTFLDGCLAVGVLAALAANATLGWWWADPAAAGIVGAAAGWAARENWKASA